MKSIHIPCAIREDYFTVEVVFQNTAVQSRPYTYKVNKLIKLEVTDQVIVPTVHGTKIATVWKIHDIPEIDYDAHYEYNWVIQKIDLGQYNKDVEIDGIIVSESRKKENEIRRKQARDLLVKNLGGADFLALLNEKAKQH